MLQRRWARRQLLRRMGRLALGGVFVGSGGWEYASAVEPGWLEIQPVTLTLPRLAPAFDGYRVVQFSDIHMSSWMTRARLAEALLRACPAVHSLATSRRPRGVDGTPLVIVPSLRVPDRGPPAAAHRPGPLPSARRLGARAPPPHP